MPPAVPRGSVPRADVPSWRAVLKVVVAAYILSACGDSIGRKDPIVFGLAGPMQVSYGETTRQGAELARKEINGAGGLGGQLLEFEVRDDEEDGKKAITVASELLADQRVLAVVGHVTSGAMLAAADIYNQGLPALATSATSPEISRAGEWVFRVASSDSANAAELARTAHGLGLRTAVMYANEGYGRGLTRNFSDALKESGGSVAGADPYVAETEDFSPYLQRIKRQGTGLIFLAGTEVAAARVVAQARALGVDARFMGGDGIEALVGMGPAYDETMVGVHFHPDASASARRFAAAFRAEYKREPDSSAALAYDAVKLLWRAVADGNDERDSIQRYLSGVGREGGSNRYDGVAGPVAFDVNGDPVNKTFTVGIIRDGALQLPGGSR